MAEGNNSAKVYEPIPQPRTNHRRLASMVLQSRIESAFVGSLKSLRCEPDAMAEPIQYVVTNRYNDEGRQRTQIVILSLHALAKMSFEH